MKEIEINIQNLTLAKLLEVLKKENIKEANFNNLEFVLDMSNCYYEGDYPTMQLVGKIDA